jgi:hypothetical protein
MLQIMIACKRTGQFVPAGIETDIDTFMAVRRRCLSPGAPHAAAIIIGQKARLGFATLNLHCARCCLPTSSVASNCCAGTNHAPTARNSSQNARGSPTTATQAAFGTNRAPLMPSTVEALRVKAFGNSKWQLWVE